MRIAKQLDICKLKSHEVVNLSILHIEHTNSWIKQHTNADFPKVLR